MRVIAGSAGGRRLVVPARGTRPTSDRVRESLFSTLDSELGEFDGRHVLDLYAGSGAVGVEAASRGAAHVLLVDSAQPAVVACRRNAALVPDAAVAVIRADVAAFVAAGPGAPATPPYDVAVLDPPYDLAGDRVTAVLAGLVEGGWLADAALVVVERDARSPALAWPDGLQPRRSRRLGETVLWYGRRT
ncbi:MAG: 16S rRNA (guanine(966)-N(2))-methyltransferase RsmD [Actinomycetota bacterium]|nr:MAG: 16S rRNA (guanine(966)-N(2))-methyltransferase RsmD [Actinomycetota bacterium]